MNTVTIPKKEYEILKEAKRRLEEALGIGAVVKDKKNDLLLRAFGVLRGNFGKKSSGFYVSKMRKSWRT